MAREVQCGEWGRPASERARVPPCKRILDERLRLRQTRGGGPVSRIYQPALAASPAGWGCTSGIAGGVDAGTALQIRFSAAHSAAVSRGDAVPSPRLGAALAIAAIAAARSR